MRVLKEKIEFQGNTVNMVALGLRETTRRGKRSISCILEGNQVE